MKKFIIGLSCLAGIGVFFIGQETPEKSTDLTLENIEVIGLSAAETTCEGTNDADCYTYDENGMLSGKSKGPLKHWH